MWLWSYVRSLFEDRFAPAPAVVVDCSVVGHDYVDQTEEIDPFGDGFVCTMEYSRCQVCGNEDNHKLVKS